MEEEGEEEGKGKKRKGKEEKEVSSHKNSELNSSLQGTSSNNLIIHLKNFCI